MDLTKAQLSWEPRKKERPHLELFLLDHLLHLCKELRSTFFTDLPPLLSPSCPWPTAALANISLFPPGSTSSSSTSCSSRSPLGLLYTTADRRRLCCPEFPRFPPAGLRAPEPSKCPMSAPVKAPQRPRSAGPARAANIGEVLRVEMRNFYFQSGNKTNIKKL